jgi:hypothetical protein
MPKRNQQHVVNVVALGVVVLLVIQTAHTPVLQAVQCKGYKTLLAWLACMTTV